MFYNRDPANPALLMAAPSPEEGGLCLHADTLKGLIELAEMQAMMFYKETVVMVPAFLFKYYASIYGSFDPDCDADDDVAEFFNLDEL